MFEDLLKASITVNENGDKVLRLKSSVTDNPEPGFKEDDIRKTLVEVGGLTYVRVVEKP